MLNRSAEENGSGEAPREIETVPAMIQLVSVNVGRPQVIGTHRGKPIVSGIIKEPVTAQTLWLTTTNLEGDGQADLSVHGGRDKAVYAYPTEHLPRWNEELGTSFGVGRFGENLSTAGMGESEARIGDLWRWGEAIVQVVQPRSPCYKLATVTRRPDIIKRMRANGRTGWYLRVIEPGSVPVDGPLTLIERDPAGLTVLDAHRAIFGDGLDRDRLEALIVHPALPESLRGRLRQSLD